MDFDDINEAMDGNMYLSRLTIKRNRAKDDEKAIVKRRKSRMILQ